MKKLTLKTVVQGATLGDHLAWAYKELEPPVVATPSMAHVVKILRDTILLATGQELKPDKLLEYAPKDLEPEWLPPPVGFRRRD